MKRANLIIAIAAGAGISRIAAQVALEGFVVAISTPFCGEPSLNAGVTPHYLKKTYIDHRFNAEPQSSTFERKINRSTKRW